MSVSVRCYGFLSHDLAAQFLELFGEDGLQLLGVNAAVVDGGGGLDAHLLMANCAATAPWTLSLLAVRK